MKENYILRVGSYYKDYKSQAEEIGLSRVGTEERLFEWTFYRMLISQVKYRKTYVVIKSNTFTVRGTWDSQGDCGAGTRWSGSQVWPEVFTQDICQLDFLLLHRKGTKELLDEQKKGIHIQYLRHSREWGRKESCYSCCGTYRQACPPI